MKARSKRAVLAASVLLLAGAGVAPAAERYEGQIVDLRARAGQATDFFTLQIDTYSSDNGTRRRTTWTRDGLRGRSRSG